MSEATTPPGDEVSRPLVERLDGLPAIVDLLATGEATAPNLSAFVVRECIDEAIAALKAPVDWGDAAAAICGAIAAPAERAFRKAADDVYADLLSDVQEYLRENALFNLGSELASAKREAADAREQLGRVAEALGTYRGGWPGPAPRQMADEAITRVEQLKLAEQGVAAAERVSIIRGLNERADWLRSEASKGGAASLRDRAEESLSVASLIERGRFSAKETA